MTKLSLRSSILPYYTSILPMTRCVSCRLLALPVEDNSPCAAPRIGSVDFFGAIK